MSELEQRLSELIPSSSSALFEAARYALLGGGKRMRPRLLIRVAEGFGAKRADALDPACAIEMIHAYSLIHDDLPCMDDDDLRRGKPTLHKVYGEALALLTGDFLLTQAFHTLACAKDLAAEQKIALIELFARSAGASQGPAGMIAGQVIDIEAKGRSIDAETLDAMHKGKTASLLIASLQAGAILGSAREIFHLTPIGEKMGLIYQYADDLLDATGAEETLGKKAGGDAAQDKPTAVSLFGIEGTLQRIDQLQQAIEREVRNLPPLVAEAICEVVQSWSKKFFHPV